MNSFGMDFQGGDGGGGFAPSNGFGGGSQASGGGRGGSGGGSQDSGQKRPKRNYDEQTIIPVTLSMILKTRADGGGDNGLLFEDGRSVQTVKVVAAVRSAEDQSTNVMYILEDGTATMDVKQWLDDNDPSALTELRHQTARDGIYVKVIGQVKEYDGKKQILASAVRPLSSGNELTHHLLEVVHSAEKFKRDTSIVPPMPVPAGHDLNSNNNSSNNMAMGLNGMDGGGGLKERVKEVFNQYSGDSEEGLAVQHCFQYLPDVPQADIREVIGQMSEEGEIYSTISEDHFRLAN
mmetsp:Transcript_1579/g.3517  ORF Transcript_1579/g.3517 Transcript_1579/m.3517 type:complete len:292 (+) Transcript_1579:202-1077(+)